jgi:hypothetical protein
MGWVGASSLLLGDWFVRRQAADIVPVLRGISEPVALYGRGDNAALIAAVAVNEAPVRWFVLRDGFVSFRQFVDRPKSLKTSFELRTTDKARVEPYDREIPFFYIPFRALEYTDIAEMLRRAPGAVVDPINGDWERMSAAEARQLLPRNVRVVAGEAPEAALGELMR